MCWNREVSAVLAVAGAGAAWTQWKWGRPKGRIIFFAYWALIECLQIAQYAVIDQCSNPINKVGCRREGSGACAGKPRHMRPFLF